MSQKMVRRKRESLQIYIIVWAKSPRKSFTDVHLVSLFDIRCKMESLIVCEVWKRLNPLENKPSGFSVSVTFQWLVVVSLFLFFYFLKFCIYCFGRLYEPNTWQFVYIPDRTRGAQQSRVSDVGWNQVSNGFKWIIIYSQIWHCTSWH